MCTQRRFLLVLSIVALLTGCCTTDPRKVAVLITTEQAEFPSLENNSEFWHDTVLTYCMLRENGFKDKDIYVLYGDGEDGYPDAGQGVYQLAGANSMSTYYSLPDYCDRNEFDSKITDYPVSLLIEGDPIKASGTRGCFDAGAGKWYCRWPVCFQDDSSGQWRCQPKNIFDCLAAGCPDPRAVFECPTCSDDPIQALNEDDFLFVWWKGHAQASGGDANTFKLLLSGNQVSPVTVGAWLSNVVADHRAFVIETCKSGCLESLASDLFGAANGRSPIILASCGCDQKSWSADSWSFEAEHLHGPWSFWVASTLRQNLPQGFLKPGQTPAGISFSLGGPLDFTFQQSKNATTEQLDCQQHPVLKDPECLASLTRINLKDPSENVTSNCPPSNIQPQNPDQ